MSDQACSAAKACDSQKAQTVSTKGDCASKCEGAKAQVVSTKKTECASKCEGTKAQTVSAPAKKACCDTKKVD